MQRTARLSAGNTRRLDSPHASVSRLCRTGDDDASA